MVPESLLPPPPPTPEALTAGLLASCAGDVDLALRIVRDTVVRLVEVKRWREPESS